MLFSVTASMLKSPYLLVPLRKSKWCKIWLLHIINEKTGSTPEIATKN